MSHIDIEQLKRRNPIAEVVRRHGVELRGQGRRLTGRCPFHEDRTPSFCVYPETESFHCFGCGAAGDVIDFVRRTEGLGFREAVLRLGGGASGGGTGGSSVGTAARVLELPAGVKDVSELGARPGGRDAFFRLLGAERRDTDVAITH